MRILGVLCVEGHFNAESAEIYAEVAEKIDLIVMGTRGMGGFKKMLLGSVSSGVVTHAQCTVLVVR